MRWGSKATRVARLEEGLQAITSLLRSEEPVTFAGRFFQLQEAQLPQPTRATCPFSSAATNPACDAVGGVLCEYLECQQSLPNDLQRTIRAAG